MCRSRLRKFEMEKMETMTMKTRQWRTLKAMETRQSNTAAEVVAQAQMPLVEISERRAQAQERVEQMADERRLSFIV